MTKNTEKKVYQTPALTVHGDVSELTQAIANRQTRLDATFPTTTPFPDLRYT